MLVKSIAECSPLEHSAILSTFIKLYYLSLRILFRLFLSGRFTQVLLYDVLKDAARAMYYKHVNV